MAQRRRIKTLPNSSSDLISHLPVEIKDRILERLPIREAARTALLSTHWNDAWLQHGRLAFDSKFFWRFGESKGRSLVPYVKIITYILLQRVRPVKKFSLFISYLKLFDPKLEQSDLDQWFRFLSRNGVEELDISLGGTEYKLPLCIVSCPTVKQLVLCSVRFDLPLNAPCIFPCVTSLIFARLRFNHNVNGIVYSIPNLEKLELIDCGGNDNFKISAPKLESLSITGFTCEVESGWVAVHLKAIKVLCLAGSLLLDWGDAVASFPTAINLQVIRLRSLDFDIEKQLKGVVLLLQKSPNLCELDIIGECSYDDMQNDDMENDHIEAASSLLKDPESCVINQDLKILKTIEIGHFRGSTLEMLLVKMLLSKSPTLERVVITESHYIKDGCTVIKLLRELLCFPRASPKAQIVIKGKDYA
ncbi:F-box/FBD/LRR-repeat protein At1g13570-like [Ipomoea triloba]|uniref:F-box/FBD/LRR-repeat protein At1g13570-like n=1 Tax=Ipomoea triloba TaxID=35885 RepID=UPI00125D5CC7|nr:F-box/FBD/LRR-repeat protein At1g13570-like [Ipomoea triloba]XP_031122228.1 F-box/FBD/LRR-repeat protein At1g13570-like [Ipomoea triloba]